MAFRSSIQGKRSLAVKIGAWLIVGLAIVTTGAAAQRGFGGGQRRSLSPFGTPWIYDGKYVFCRLAFQESRDGDGGSWSVDYPKADMNFPFRLGELTEVPISRDAVGEPNHVIVSLTDPHLFQCPFVMMTEPGSVYFSDEEAGNLRAYLDKGGFLWADDFWGEYAWQIFEREMRKALPAAEFPLNDLPMSHPIFDMSYKIERVIQIPSINFYLGTGQTSERVDSTVPHVRAIENARGHMIVLITHNTDFGDAFEREGEDRRFFDRFASQGYAFGINAFLYAMTH